ncbi:hypothetical protein CY34DRAFT_814602, partial [Suillus luteus UH-Slu-Lm8-n1]
SISGLNLALRSISALNCFCLFNAEFWSTVDSPETDYRRAHAVIPWCTCVQYHIHPSHVSSYFS